MQIHGRECSRGELSKESKAACYRSSREEDSRLFGFRSEKIIDDVAQSGFSDVMGHTACCSGLRYRSWKQQVNANLSGSLSMMN